MWLSPRPRQQNQPEGQIELSRREIVNKGKIRDLTTYKQNINKHEEDKKSLINKHVKQQNAENAEKYNY